MAPRTTLLLVCVAVAVAALAATADASTKKTIKRSTCGNIPRFDHAWAAAGHIIDDATPMSTWMKHHGLYSLPAAPPKAMFQAPAWDQAASQAFLPSSLMTHSGTATTLMLCRDTPVNDLDFWSENKIARQSDNKLVWRVELAQAVGVLGAAGYHAPKDNLWWKNGGSPIKDATVHLGGFTYTGVKEYDIWTPEANFVWGRKALRKSIQNMALQPSVASKIEIKLVNDNVHPPLERVVYALPCDAQVEMKYGLATDPERGTYGMGDVPIAPGGALNPAQRWGEFKGLKKAKQDIGDIICLCTGSICNSVEQTNEGDVRGLCQNHKWSVILANYNRLRPNVPADNLAFLNANARAKAKKKNLVEDVPELSAPIGTVAGVVAVLNAAFTD